MDNIYFILGSNVSRPTSIYGTTPRNAATRTAAQRAAASTTAAQRAEWLKGLHCNSVDSILGNLYSDTGAMVPLTEVMEVSSVTS